MKKSVIFLTVILCVAMVLPTCAAADDSDSSVVFNGSQILTEGNSSISIGNILPGQKTVYKVAFRNATDADTDWYVKNDIKKSFEDTNKATGGAYQYKITYIDPSGAETVLFSSDNVGSDTDNSKVGLHQTSDALTEDYFFLDTLSASQKGYIVLEVSLDGESQNVYMKQQAEIGVKFQVVSVETTPKKVVDTGYQTRVFLYVAAAFLCLVILGTTTAKMKRSAAGGGAHE